MVPLFDLTRQYQSLKTEIDAAVLNLLASGQYVLGPAVEEFEALAARELGVKHTIGVANGTDALQIALRALKIEPGDEVITTPFSFYSAAEVIADLGAVPVFVDIEADTFNIDPRLIEAAITAKTRAIIPVHIFGHPAPMTEINAIAQKHGLKVIEDSAQGWGASLNGTMCGNLADAGTFSFFPSKNLGACGEGGLISTGDDEVAKIARNLRVHGQSRRYYYDEIGYNSRLHALQAAILSVKLPEARGWNQSRRRHAAQYAQLLGETPLVLPGERSGACHVYHQYTLRVPQHLNREKICAHLSEKGIGWAIYYPHPLHLQPVFEGLGYTEGQMPVSENACREVLSLPIFPELEEREIEEVGAALNAAF
ncbi:dTDP-4-amino-4,6-dideoxygalactose transaminase [Abditibacterium utsteinense]|uniref:dTDP-4-amino-4,6-dideoxygalactose transaminase n=1 Tax=Abditibacterium utsteinense TaxID=1960156 RepID=A0A2S8SQR3_9BACT|nr:DegT/DnrJ/EryC1/StrS family aminotransferase [Abditibacterium utsteinense]PQV63128.1 dTDP-4-amino-4,6-dideoxygalactose transaminase [Abditibacterium utsteinense]